MSNWKPTPPPFVNFKNEVHKKGMKVGNFIYQIGESEILRQSSEEIPLNQFSSNNIQAKFNYLKSCLLRYRKLTGYGRGITAIQVGIPLRFSVIYKGQTIRNIKNKVDVTLSDMMIMANPKITKASKKLLKYPEMCMSLNPVIVPTIRPSWIEFDYYDENGKKHYWDTKDDTEVGKMMNRVFQHEFDHMDGVVNIDKIENPKEIILESDPEFYSHAKFEEVNQRK